MSVAVVGGLRWVEHVMGTTVSIVVEPPLVSDEVIDEVVADLHDVDARFSTYKPDSEISRLMRGELSEATPASMSAMSSLPATTSRRSRAAPSMPAGTGRTVASIRPATSRAGRSRRPPG